jgi:hypothetical protein
VTLQVLGAHFESGVRKPGSDVLGMEFAEDGAGGTLGSGKPYVGDDPVAEGPLRT